jgi:hypothetical protein
VLSRLVATGAFIILACAAAVQAQEGQQPPPEAPPPAQEGPPPKQDDLPPPPEAAPPPRRQEPLPPPRAEISPGERWGAVAYTADGAFGASYGIETKEDAERLAIDECRRESTDKADCARGVVTRRDSWFHIQFCRRGRDWSTHITSERTLSETNAAAAQFARTSRYGPENCRLVPNGLFHSGGLHLRM